MFSRDARKAVSNRKKHGIPIDFSDIPESTDAELKRARRVGRPLTAQAKQLIAIRIASRLLAQIRRRAAQRSMPYQTLIHEMLAKAVTRAA